MNDSPKGCPLSPRQIELLLTCCEHGTTITKSLVKLLDLSPHTIDGYFKDISARLHTENRNSSLWFAIESGWIAPPKSFPHVDQIAANNSD